MNLKADRIIIAQVPMPDKDSAENRALAMNDFLTSITRGWRHTTDNDVVVIFRGRDAALAHMLRVYIHNIATCQEKDNSYPEKILESFPE